MSYFFEQFGQNSSETAAIQGLSDNEQDGFEQDDIMSRKETLDLVRTYYSVEDPEARKDIMKFIKSMAERL